MWRTAIFFVVFVFVLTVFVGSEVVLLGTRRPVGWLRAADSIVADLNAKATGLHADAHRHGRGVRVLDGVDQAFGDDVVGGLFHRAGKALRGDSGDRDRDGGSFCQRPERCRQTGICQECRVDSVCQLADLLEPSWKRRCV